MYVAFVIDCFSRAIVGWHASSVKDTTMVTTALKMALWRRDHGGHAVADGLIHHSDAGSQYTSISLAETLALEGIVASIGSVGDAYDCEHPGHVIVWGLTFLTIGPAGAFALTCRPQTVAPDPSC